MGKHRLAEGIKQDLREGVEKMLVTVLPIELLDGLLSGLQAQGEISQLLEELYYDGLS